MSSPVNGPVSDAQRLVEASAWRVRLADANLETSEAFERWLDASQRNRQAWEHVQRAWSLFGEHASAPELLELRRRALGQAQAASRRRWRKGVFTGFWARAALAAGFGVLAIGMLLIWGSHRVEVYRTDLGERRLITLEDGSQVELDARTELRVAYSKRARDLTLVEGQAHFDVAHDIERPFAVFAAGRKVIATGTAFNMDLLGATLSVTLIEGRVVVLPRAESAGGPIELSAGEQLTVSPGGAAAIAPVNVQSVVAWQNGQLVFDDEPLSTVIAQINRYAAKPVTLSGERTASLRISGVFSTGDVDGFVSTISHYLPVAAKKSDSEIVLSHR